MMHLNYLSERRIMKELKKEKNVENRSQQKITVRECTSYMTTKGALNPVKDNDNK